jgi:hypothetical protein
LEASVLVALAVPVPPALPLPPVPLVPANPFAPVLETVSALAGIAQTAIEAAANRIDATRRAGNLFSWNM